MKKAHDFQKIYLYREPVDMRKQINGLAELVEDQMQQDLFANSLFLFCNRRRDIFKAIYFDKAGFCLWMKKLDQDRFPWFKSPQATQIKITSEDFNLLIDGVDVFKRHNKLDFGSYS